jgi:hypothetical protein
VKFEKGNKLAKGGKRPGSGRPTKEEAAAKAEMLKVAFDRLKSSAGKAVETLVKHLGSSQPNISIRAAEDIIEFTQRALEHEELEKRIEALEARVNEQRGYR